MQNIKMLINEADGNMHDICRIVVYLTDVRHREPIYREMGEHLKGVFPCSTGIVVTALARPEWVWKLKHRRYRHIAGRHAFIKIFSRPIK